MTELQQLSHDSFYNMRNYSQITIDYIEDVEDILSAEYYGEGEKEDVLKAISYNVSNVIEIISPALETDVNAFFKLDKIINEYLDKAESTQ
jgi:predicted AAA+ superfamily ATPase